MRQAKVISDGMSLVNTIVSKTRVCYLFTNHEYQKIGVSWGNTRETRGGGKPKYFATVRLQLTPIGRIKEADEFSSQDREIGKQIRVKALKNHMGGQLLERDAIIVNGSGFVDTYTVLEIAKAMNLVTGKGWSTWVGSNNPQHHGQPQPRAFFRILGGEEREEDLAPHFSRYAHPRVADD